MIEKSSRLLLAVGCVAGVLMMFGTTLDVVMRYAFGSPIVNLSELISAYLMVAIVFLPLASVEFRQGHICADMLVRLFPEELRRIVFRLAALVGACVCLVFCYQTTLDALKATERLEQQMGSSLFYTWPSKWILPVGFLALAVAMVRNAWLGDPGMDEGPLEGSPQELPDER